MRASPLSPQPRRRPAQTSLILLDVETQEDAAKERAEGAGYN